MSKVVQQTPRNPLYLLNQLIGLTLAFLILGTWTGCSKKRPTELTEEQSETIFSKADFHNAKFTLKTYSDFKYFYPGSGETIKRFEIGEVKANQNLEKIFDDFQIENPSSVLVKGESILHPEKKLIAYKIVSLAEFSALSAFEKTLAIKIDEDNYKIELFNYPVDQYGVLETVKNDLGENTNKMRFRETSLDKASHVMLRFDQKKVIPEVQEKKDTIFSKYDFQDYQFSVKIGQNPQIIESSTGESIEKYQVVEVKAHQNLSKMLEGLLMEGRPNQIIKGKIALRTDNKLVAYKLVTNDELQLLSKLEKSIAKEVEGGKFQIELFSYPIQKYGVLKVVKNENGELTNKMELSETSFEESTHIIMGIGLERSLPSLKKVDDLRRFEEDRVISVDDFRDKEFLYRRTLIDSPNLFNHSFAGLSGQLEIVKFHFKESLLEIKRSGPILGKDGTTIVDKETLLSLPITYYKKRDKDGQGNPLTSFEYVEANFNEKNTIAVIDWTQNSIPNISSPISFFSEERCFSGARSKEISDVDKQTKGQLFSFTLSTTYASNADLDCVKFEGNRGATQTTFTFKERLSFKEYLIDSDEKPLISIPYNIQKKLGLGLFTYEKTVPTALGGTGIKGTRVSLPAIFDIRKTGKSDQFNNITYVLAGIPEADAEPVLRKKLIEATKEVIGDLNKAFKKALAGTELERKEQVVTLMVEGLSKSEEEAYGLANIKPKVMGDLDRNYIYYIRKGTESLVIGLGGSHHNPRSGKVEAASVFIYGGNLKTALESFKRRNKAEQEYAQNMKLPKGVPYLIPPAPDTQPQPVRPTTPTHSGGIHSRSGNVHAHGSQSKALLELIDKNHGSFSNYLEEIKTEGTFVQKNRSSYHLLDQHASLLSSEARDFYLKFQKGFQEDVLQDPYRMAAIFDGKIQDGKVIEHSDKKNLSKILGRMQRQDICFYHSSLQENLAAATADGRTKDATDEEILIAMYKPTLAHELGHNFGLRHNFQGSYDLVNHFFNPDDTAESRKKEFPRTYSSIMDYLSDDHYSYDGFGPYDVYALRAAYTGKISKEVSSPTEKAFISLDEILKELKLENWEDVTLSDIRGLNIKEFKFCSDEDVGQDPTCDRFDNGTSPSEIVENLIHQYKATYSMANFRGPKLEFTRDHGDYLGRITSIFTKLRKFLDECLFRFYKMGMNPAPQTRQEAVDFLFAAYQTYEFLREVVQTPDASFNNSQDDNSRFEVVVGKNFQGRPINLVVERKWPYDLDFDALDGQDFWQLSVKGIQLDKAMALLVLTGDTSGRGRYKLDGNFAFTFYQFERLFLPILQQISGATKPIKITRLNSPLLNLLKDVLLDQIRPMKIYSEEISGASGMMIPVKIPQDLSNYFQAQSTQLMKNIATQGAILGLDTSEAFDIEDDPSSVFKVFSKSLPPIGSDYVTQIDSADGDKYWASSDALFAKGMIQESAALEALRKASPELTKNFKRYFSLKTEKVSEERKEAHQKELKETEEILQGLFKQLPPMALSTNPATPINLETLYKLLGIYLEDAALIYSKLEEEGKEVEREINLLFERSKNKIQVLCSKFPILLVFIYSMEKKDLNQMALQLRPSAEQFGTRRGKIFNTARQLSDFYYLLHPNSNR